MDNVMFLIIELMIPLIMLILGVWFRFSPPPFGTVGYHTEMTLRNKEAWDMAQVVFGRNMLILAPPTLVLSAAAGTAGILMRLDSDTGTLCMVGVVIVQSAVLTAGIIMTECKLRKFFNSDGTPRKK